MSALRQHNPEPATHKTAPGRLSFADQASRLAAAGPCEADFNQSRPISIKQTCMKSSVKIAVLALSLSCGLAGGWYSNPNWLWQRQPTYAAPPDSRSGNEILVAQLEFNSHCVTQALASEWQWLEDRLLPKLLASGSLTRLSPGQYQPGSRLEIVGNGSLRLPVSSFGRVDAANYFEIYYLTPRSFSAVLGLFKATPRKSGIYERVIRQSLGPGGLKDEQILRIESSGEGTRVACRELKARHNP